MSPGGGWTPGMGGDPAVVEEEQRLPATKRKKKSKKDPKGIRGEGATKGLRRVQ